MLNQLMDLVKENAGDLIVNNAAVPNQFNDAAISEASKLIEENLSKAISGGNVQDVLGLFGNAQNISSNPMVAGIVGQLAQSLGSKFGVDGAQAQHIAGSLIPQILGGLAAKTNDPNNAAFNINDITSQLSGGKAVGIDFGSVISQMQQGGKVDLGGLAGQFLGGQKGGLGDMLGGFFKK